MFSFAVSLCKGACEIRICRFIDLGACMAVYPWQRYSNLWSTCCANNRSPSGEALSAHILRAPSFYSCPIDYCNMQHHSSPLSNECALASKFIFTYILMFAPCCSLLLCRCSVQPAKRTYKVNGK
jgi:hypothetical protein